MKAANRLILACGLALAVAAGMVTWNTQAGAQTTGGPAPTTAPAAPDPILFQINGTPISRQAFNQVLYEVAGPQVFMEFMQDILAMQACNQAGIPITDDMVKAEKARIIADIKDGAAKAGKPIADDQMDGVFYQVLARQGVTPSMVEWWLRRNVCMRALAKGRVPAVTEEMINDAFEYQYGERLQGRVMVFGTMTEAMDFTEAVNKKKKPVLQAAQELSVQSQEFRITPKTDVKPPIMKDAAMQLKDGEISAAIPNDNRWLIIYLEKRTPKSDTKLADVRDKLKVSLQEQMELQWAQNHLQNLLLTANIETRDSLLLPSLRYLEQAKAQARQAATQASATQPTTAPAATVPAPAAKTK